MVITCDWKRLWCAGHVVKNLRGHRSNFSNRIWDIGPYQLTLRRLWKLVSFACLLPVGVVLLGFSSPVFGWTSFKHALRRKGCLVTVIHTHRAISRKISCCSQDRSEQLHMAERRQITLASVCSGVCFAAHWGPLKSGEKSTTRRTCKSPKKRTKSAFLTTLLFFLKVDHFLRCGAWCLRITEHHLVKNTNQSWCLFGAFEWWNSTYHCHRKFSFGTSLASRAFLKQRWATAIETLSKYSRRQ